MRNRIYPTSKYADVHSFHQANYVTARGKTIANAIGKLGRFQSLIHTDFGTDVEAFFHTIKNAYSTEYETIKQKYNEPEVKGLQTINFWRPINMEGPCQHNPLAICDPNTVRFEDILQMNKLNSFDNGEDHKSLAMKYHPDQKWYYYPEMTNDEVLIFKTFH